MHIRFKFSRLGPGLVLVALAVGCHQALPPQADADKARTALVTALDAWKKGEVPDLLNAIRRSISTIRNARPMWRYWITRSKTATITMARVCA